MNLFDDIIGAVSGAVSESWASRSRRNEGSERLIAPPPAGTPLLVSLAVALEHTGVYIGENKVVELQDDGFVKAVSLTDFINGDTAPWPLRNGTRIFAACDACSRNPISRSAIASVARRMADDSYYVGYDFIRHNCHFFTASCAVGLEPNNEALVRLFAKGAVSIGRLERFLARRLNDQRRIEWCPVARHKERFHYKLTTEKLVRLRMEGKR